MTNEEREKHIRIANMLIGAINDLERPMLMYQIEKDVTKEALENYIKMLEQQPCKNCIDKEALINELKLEYFNKDLQEGKNDPCVIDAMIDWAIRAVKRQPSVTPQPKIGYWEYVQYDSNPNIGNWHCSECKGICTEMHSIEDSYNYCPNCGAKMEVEE